VSVPVPEPVLLGTSLWLKEVKFNRERFGNIYYHAIDNIFAASPARHQKNIKVSNIKEKVSNKH